MRVMHLLNTVTDRGNGIVNAAVDLAIEQAHQGIEVVVVSAGGGYQKTLESNCVFHRTLDQSRNPVQLVRAVGSLKRLIRNFQPDVVHAHMRTGLLLAWICRRFRQFALVGHVHNVHDRESILMGMADRVIAVSESVAATMAERGIPQRKIRVVLNRTLGSSRVPPLEAIKPAKLDHPSIVTVGGMNQRKGIEELIAAFETVARHFPAAQLYLVGDGPDREQFERQARASTRASRIHFEGYQAAPQAYMKSADVFVLASRRESFGLVLIEAREAGCPIIATNVDGIAEALDGGRAGLMVPAQDARALADAICQMLSSRHEQEKWRRSAQQGVDQFHIRYMAIETAAVYEELLNAQRPLATQTVGQPKLAPIPVRIQSPRSVDGRE
ncbi:MAG TPA: glycosyltransferase family 4 protein [Terracidiphilus sp.]|jgi:glycosyltransferase involved in cell wall biosynthesis|nr:glycosyltransferase family 4 protein [Terracidiphilus sp.]